jgi:hypothetical protein
VVVAVRVRNPSSELDWEHGPERMSCDLDLGPLRSNKTLLTASADEFKAKGTRTATGRLWKA